MVDGGTVDIEDVFAAMDANPPRTKYMYIDGNRYNAKSQRYILFKSKGTDCVSCGLVGRYFRKERHPTDIHFHLNLYGIDHLGHEVLITKDHIVPRAQKGGNNLNNYQTMCTVCNMHKADKV